MWNLKFDTNEHSYETETYSDIKNRLVVSKEEIGWGGKSGSLELADANNYTLAG